MQFRFLSATATAVLLSAFGAALAGADDRLPFDPRVAHIYESQTPTATTSFSTYFRQRSTDLWEQHFLGGEDDGLVQLWAENAEHDKYLHGFERGDLVVTYTPPILWIDAPLALHQTWDASTSVDGKPLAIHFEVTLQLPVEVPAGTFDIFAIESTVQVGAGSLAGAGRRGLDGRTLGLSATSRECFAADVGLVISESEGRADQLAAITDIQAVVPATWSSIRALYR